MDVGAAVEADEQASELVQPGEAALDYPAVATQAAAVFGAAAGDDWFDAELPDQAAVLVVVIATIADHHVGPLARPSDSPAYGRNGIQQGDQLGNVVSVTASQRDRERYA